jgi:carbon storage regulator CsrA
MLILSRKLNDSIVLTQPGDAGAARVVVVQIAADKIRLGIEAPRDWQVQRSEFLEPPDEGAGTPVRT